MEQRRNKNGYGHRGSMGNSGQKYQQSPGFVNQQYYNHNIQAQHYVKGIQNNNGRKHAYSVDHKQYKNNHKQKPLRNNEENQQNQQYQQYQQQLQQLQQQQYAQQQQQQKQQQQEQEQKQKQKQKQQQKQRRNRQRRANSPTGYDEANNCFFNNNNNNDDHHQQRYIQKQHQQKQYQKYQQEQEEKLKQQYQRRQQRRSTRSKSPNIDQQQQQQQHQEEQEEEQRRNRKQHKYSVPNVSNNNYISTPNKKHSHNSTPNAEIHQIKQRRDSTKRRRDRDRDKSPNINDLDHVHEERVNKVRRGSKKSRSKTPNINNKNKEKQRRHTTTGNQSGSGQRRSGYHSKSANPGSRTNGNGGRRKKRSSKSPNPHRKSAHDLNQQSNFAKLNKGRLAERFIIREKLGRGNFSVVRRVIRKVDEKEFAAKIISTKALSQQEIKDTHDEVKILGKLHHPNIVTLIDYIFTPRHLYIVLELLDGGELFERLQKKKKFNEQMAANITKQIADALGYMHSKGVVHRDLKPENILYENKSCDAKIKISDFGLSRDTKAKNARPLKTACGTPGYVAPEIIRQQAYDESVDLWAAGVIIYILLCGFPPFQGAGGVDPQQTMFRKIKSGKYSYPKPAWSKISACAMDCIDSLLCVNPNDRMTAKELLQHPWIKQAEIRNDDSFLDIHFQSNLSNYLHKKRFRRGVRLIITLNRMIRGAGLEETAREQRRKFRIRLKKYKDKLKAEKRRIYNKQQQLKLMNVTSDQYDDYEEMGYTIIDPDSTPAIDYSKV